MLYSELCTCKVVMRETAGGRAGTQPAACSSTSHSPRLGGKKEKKTLFCTRPKYFFRHHKPYPSNSRRALEHSRIWALRSVGSSYDKRELHSKMHPAVCAGLFFLFFYKTSGPDLIVTQAEQLALVFVVQGLQRFQFVRTPDIQVSYDLKRNAEIRPIYCSCVSVRSQRQREKCFLWLQEAFKASLK